MLPPGMALVERFGTTPSSSAARNSSRSRTLHLRQQDRACDPSAQEQVARTTAIQRVAVLMLGVFGGLALLLAAIGLYGVMSYTVSQRTRELGLRMELGADAGDLVRLVMSNGLLLMAGGVVFGAVA